MIGRKHECETEKEAPKGCFYWTPKCSNALRLIFLSSLHVEYYHAYQARGIGFSSIDENVDLASFFTALRVVELAFFIYSLKGRSNGLVLRAFFTERICKLQNFNKTCTAAVLDFLLLCVCRYYFLLCPFEKLPYYFIITPAIGESLTNWDGNQSGLMYQ